MELKIVCTYCDHTVTRTFYDAKSAQGIKCEKCGDRNLILKDNNKEKLDTYVGCPPFPEKKVVKAPYWSWGMGGD